MKVLVTGGAGYVGGPTMAMIAKNCKRTCRGDRGRRPVRRAQAAAVQMPA